MKVEAQTTTIPYYTGTTANVSILGNLGGILVDYVPVDFTAGSGLQPATVNNTKTSWGLNYIRVKTNSSTNVPWCLYINATVLAAGWTGDVPDSTKAVPIPANNITVITDCNGTIGNPSYVNLSSTLQLLCCDDAVGGNDNNGLLESKDHTDINFTIDIPAGWTNETYNGSFWLHANASAAADGFNNETWYSGTIQSGHNGTNVIVRQYYEIGISNVSIDFGALAPRWETYNAVPNEPPINYTGWPATFTNGAASNVFIDMYIQGTDLECTSDSTSDCFSSADWGGGKAKILLNDNNFGNILRGNLTYSNATDTDGDGEPNIPQPEDYHILNYSLASKQVYSCVPGELAPITSNWCRIGNNTDKSNWWNITVEPGVLGGSYGGYINYKAVDTGYASYVQGYT